MTQSDMFFAYNLSAALSIEFLVRRGALRRRIRHRPDRWAPARQPITSTPTRRMKSLGAYIAVAVVSVVTILFLRRYPTISTTPHTMSQLTIKLNDGREIPWLGFGTGTALYGKDAEKSVSNAISKGFVHLDGAQMYQNEDSLGKAITAAGVPREKLFVTTKLYKLAEGETVRDNLLQSLKKLQVDYVDLFLIHVPQDFGSGLKEIWRQFEDLKTEGLAKSIGVSNCRIRDFAALGLDEPGGVRIPPAINQIEYHPYVYAQSIAVLDYHRKHNIVTASYGGLSPIFREKGGPVDPVLDTVRERLKRDTGKEVTPGQVLGLWLRVLGIPQITTTSKESRLLEYLDTVTLPELTSEEVKAISDAGSKLQSRQFPRFMKE